MMDKTRFIIITHGRKTTEITNRLDGVTMEEPGVSKLISIQLNWPGSRFPELINGSRCCAYAGPGIGR
jgi:chromosome segregation protein